MSTYPEDCFDPRKDYDGIIAKVFEREREYNPVNSQQGLSDIGFEAEQKLINRFFDLEKSMSIKQVYGILSYEFNVDKKYIIMVLSVTPQWAEREKEIKEEYKKRKWQRQIRTLR